MGLAELLTLLGVTQGRVVAIQSGTDGAPGDAVAGAVQAAQRSAEARTAREQVVLGHLDVLEDQFAGIGGAQAPLAGHLGRGESFHAALHHDAVDAAFLVLGPDDRDVSKRRVGDPQLGAVEDDVFAITGVLEVRHHAARVGAVVRLGQPEATHHLASGELGQVLHLLLLGSVLPDGVHHEGTLHGCRAAETAVAALQLLHDDAVRNLVQASATVLLRDVGAKRANGAESGQGGAWGRPAFRQRLR